MEVSPPRRRSPVSGPAPASGTPPGGGGCPAKPGPESGGGKRVVPSAPPEKSEAGDYAVSVGLCPRGGSRPLGDRLLPRPRERWQVTAPVLGLEQRFYRGVPVDRRRVVREQSARVGGGTIG